MTSHDGKTAGTYGKLRLGGELSRESLERLLKLAKDGGLAWLICCNGEMLPGSRDLGELAAASCEHGLSGLWFSNMNSSAIPYDLVGCLDEAGLSYIWSWNRDPVALPGVSFIDAGSGKRDCFLAVRGRPVLDAEQIEHPERRAALKHWSAWSPGPLLAYDTQHERIALLRRIAEEQRPD